MASLMQYPDSYHVCFRVGATQFRRSLDTLDKKEANSKLGRIESTLHDIKVGKLPLPDGCDVGLFVLSDGKLSAKVVAPDNTTLGDLCDRYATEKIGLASSTMVTTNVHIKHLINHFGVKQIAQAIDHADVQGYVNARVKAGRANDTISKEVGTLSAMWSWGCKMKLVKGECPISQLEYPVSHEPEPFATWGEIETRIKRGKLKGLAADAQWERLWLDQDQVNEFLNHVLKVADEPYLHPMMVLIGHTGCRRSEAAASEVDDFDFVNNVVRIRELKKKQGRVTYRHVPMTPYLRSIMGEYLPTVEGQSTFGVSVKVMWSRFQDLTANSKWSVLKGFHVFRHSMASNMARKGFADRMIDAFIGHVTEEMRKRYQHLHPLDKQNLMGSLFPALSA